MNLDWYSVRLEACAPASDRDVAADESAADVLMDLLEDHAGIVSSGTGTWDAIVSVQASCAMEAALCGSGIIGKLACEAGMPPWPVVRAEAIRQDIIDAENARPALPELVSAPEAAEMLGVSPQRLHELAAGNAGFPEPLYELRTGKLWLRDAIEAFARRRERKPGRPRKITAAAG